MGRWIGIFAAGALAQAGVAAAAITDVTFHGRGVVTYSMSDPPYVIGPAVGTPVIVNGSVHLGSVGGDPVAGYPAAPPNGFTGRFVLTNDMIFDGYATFHWSVTPGDSGNSFEVPDAASGGALDFVHGRLTAVSLGFLSDPDFHDLGVTSWGFDNGTDQPAAWGGTWQLASGTPEPAAWTLMIAGFAATGLARRRRHAAA